MGPISEFLAKENQSIKELYKDACLAYWDAMITGKKEYYEDYSKKEIKLKEHFNNKERFEKIKNFLKSAENSIEKRQSEILYLNYLACQGDVELLKKISEKASMIEQQFNTFRANVDGKKVTDNDIRNILKVETDSEKRRRFWEASKKQGQVVEKELLELVRLRNKLAKSLGFGNYHMMMLELSEQKEEEIERIFFGLEEEAGETFKKAKDEMDGILAKKFGISKDEIKPWHYEDLFFQEAPDIYGVDLDKFYNKDLLKIADVFYQNIGLEIGDVAKRSDLYEKQGKYQHACCINIDKSGDVRVIENIKNTEKWMDTTLHEFGHAVYDKYCDENLPFLLRENAHTLVTEAIALLFGRHSKNTSFMKRYCDLNDEEAKKIGDKIRMQLRLDELIFLKWAQVMFHFERELYKNPDQDLNSLWWTLVKKFQLVDFKRDMPDWASKIHLSSAPVYYHNYVLGKLLASQLNNHIAKNILKGEASHPDYSNKEIGNYLRTSVFFPGNSYRWDELIKRALGEPLNPKYFVEEFCK